MQTIGWLLILVAILLIRSGVKGRGINAFTDLSDAALAIMRGDSDKLKDISQRSGNANAYLRKNTTTLNNTGPSSSSTALLNEVMRLGNAAKGYRYGATGPDYYDCSGLVWRAMTNLGLYNGSRFTTANFNSVNSQTIHATKVNDIQMGDIILWSGHMGIATNATDFYSALSVRSGIKTAPINAVKRGTPTVYRLGGTDTKGYVTV